MDTLQLVAAVDQGAQSLSELYVHVGRALFKGFEKTGGLGVYEIIPPGSALFSLLAQHHLPRWLVEHEHGKSDEDRRAEGGRG
jgi:CRISPR/Cas system CMR subunit Cmr4 (Cas7 group RAMP superfamily)